MCTCALILVSSCTVVALEIRHHPPVLPIFSFDTPRGKNIDEFDSWVWIIAQKLLCHIKHSNPVHVLPHSNSGIILSNSTQGGGTNNKNSTDVESPTPLRYSKSTTCPPHLASTMIHHYAHVLHHRCSYPSICCIAVVYGLRCSCPCRSDTTAATPLCERLIRTHYPSPPLVSRYQDNLIVSS